MEKIGEILSSGNGRLEVSFCSREDCGTCHACDGEKKNTIISLPGEGRVGDYACVELPTGTVVKASLLAYVCPLAFFLLGMPLGTQIMPDPSMGAAIFGFLFLGVSALVLYVTEKKRRSSSAWQPKLVRVIPRELRDRPVHESEAK